MAALNPLPSNTTLVTMDVTSLHTNIPGMTVSRNNRSTWVIGFVDFGKKIESARFGTVWY
jgi:hypothetical protein